MTTSLRSFGFATALILSTAAADAQTTSAIAQTTSTPQTTSSAASDESTRPATTTFFGDTGIWFVPTAEVLAHGKWSVSGYRRGTNYIEGYTNVADFAGTFAVGIKDRVEVFGSFLVDTRVDRDTYPVFITGNPKVGGIVSAYPDMNSFWSGDNVGDLYLGAKVNLLSEYRRNPVALAIRGMVKVPTGSMSAGVSTGRADGSFDLIVSKEIRRAAELAGYGGYEYDGNPSGFNLPTSAFRWGAGATFPSRTIVRGLAEVNGSVPSSSTASITGANLVGVDGTIAPLVSNTEKLTRVTFGVTVQDHKGFFVGGGLSWNLPHMARDPSLSALGDSDRLADYWDWQVRIGYHPGVRIYVPPVAPPPPPPPPAPAALVHNLAVQAACNPCTVEIGQSSTVTATVQDSIGCAVTYRWTAPTGTFANAIIPQALWTAPQQEGAVPATITVTCPSDNKTASANVTLQVTRPPAKTYTFEDVHFDFDRYSLRPEATRVLDEAVTALRTDATLKIQIEGHTCNIGTAEYNLALGDRRANAVRNYLVSRGVPADRLSTISYGEERPKYDNAREETRRLNRRAALVVNLTR